MAQIEVIATDGKMQKRILWIDIRQNGVYAGWCQENADIHLSYHSDGKVFWTTDGETQRVGTFQPLREFRGRCQIGSFAFSGDLSKRTWTSAYRLKKLRAITYIDVRYFVKERCFVGCNVFLLEPKRFDLVRTYPKTTEIHIFAQFVPWILIEVYRVRTVGFNSD